MMKESLLELTRQLLDKKTVKKETVKDYNDRIKELEAQIAACVKE
uniref:Uncharacterized protein n=1 Tax=viral metagenome TaxID=1070528 RepID=A0A6M3JQ64_9ZZZZ